MILNLPSYQFYKQYHNHPMNRAIHMVCIPGISWSICLFLTSINGFFLSSLYAMIYYYYFNKYELTTSHHYDYLLICAFLYSIWILAVLYRSFGLEPYFVAGSVFIGSWIMQFVGHYYFENNRPALLDSLHQSFLMAPLFVYLEFKQLLNNEL